MEAEGVNSARRERFTAMETAIMIDIGLSKKAQSVRNLGSDFGRLGHQQKIGRRLKPRAGHLSVAPGGGLPKNYEEKEKHHVYGDTCC